MFLLLLRKVARRAGSVRRFAALALVLATAAPAIAQEAAIDIIVEEEAAAVMQPVFADENFDQWLFNNTRNADGARAHFNSQLKLQIESVASICGITPVQKQKLMLAGRGDVVRFFEKVEESRKKFQTLKNDQNKINEIFNDIRPLQARIGQGLFGQGSLFEKTLRTTLTSSQARDWEIADRAHRQFQYRAKVELIISMLDDVAVLDDRQRKELVTFILENTRPPRQTGQYDYYVVMYQLTKVPEEKFKELLRPPQLRALNKQLQQVRGIEEFLKQQGLLEQEPAGEKDAGPQPETATIRSE